MFLYAVIIAPRVRGASRIATSSNLEGMVAIAVKGASVSISVVVAVAAAVKLAATAAA